jgi:hypothetical protein
MINLFGGGGLIQCTNALPTKLGATKQWDTGPGVWTSKH